MTVLTYGLSDGGFHPFNQKPQSGQPPSKKLRGAQIPIPAACGRGITEFALRDALPLYS